MAHRILGDRFYAQRGEYVWHPKGIRGDGTDQTAREMASQIADYEVSIEPCYTEINGSRIELPERVVMRHPVPEDDQYRSFGVVGTDFKMITPSLMAAIWDEHVSRPIHTMGVLREGRAIFMSTKLQSVGVRGEEVILFLTNVNWMEAGNANLAMLTGICPVCDNTVRAGEEVATEKLRILHDSNLIERTIEWLGGIVQRAEYKMPAFHEAMQLLANTDVNRDKAATVLSAAYPTPPAPSGDCPPGVFTERMEKYTANIRLVEEKRVTAIDLFKGEGTGMNLESRKGTVWGLYQAIAELEQYRRGGSDDQAATSMLVGVRGTTIQRAFDAALEVCRN